MKRPPSPSDPLVTRRTLLAWAAGGLVFWAAPRPGKAEVSTLPPLPDPPGSRYPGERILVWWPPFLDPSRARVVVLRDGQPAGEAPVVLPSEPGGRFLAVEARPPSPVRPGRYDFVLAVGPVRLALGGFRIAPYRFGC